MKYLEYFKELRNRLLICFSFIILSFIFFFHVGQIVEILTNPLYELMSDPSNRRMIFTGLPEVFVSNLKVALFSSFLLSIPFLIIQIILFASPALYKKEKKVFISTSFMAIFFFYIRSNFCILFFNSNNLEVFPFI